MQKKRSIVGKELRNDAGFVPGLTLFNSNGDIDPTSLGFDYAIRTTTLLRARSAKQKYYEVPIADFMTVEVGQGAWMESITTNLEFNSAGDFEAGIQGVSSGNPDVPEIEAGVSPKTFSIVSWAKGYKYNVMEINKALQADNWDKVAAQTNGLKKNWDLGLQRIAFLGSKYNPNVKGLLNQTEPTLDTATLTANISSLSADEFATFVQALLAAYFTNSNATVMPNKFVMPMDDYLGLASPCSTAFFVGTKKEYLEKMFKDITANPDFKVLPLAYCQKAFNIGATTTAGSQRYALYNDEPEVVKIDIPVDFTLTNPATADNFGWQGKAYGQLTGVQVLRPREIYYLEHHNS